MKVGGGGLEALVNYDITASTRKVQRSEPTERVEEMAGDAVEGSQAKVNPDVLVKAVDRLNKTSDLYNQGFRFKIDDGTKKLVVQIVNQDSGEVIKQIPPQEALDMEAQISKMVGLIVDKKA